MEMDIDLIRSQGKLFRKVYGIIVHENLATADFRRNCDQHEELGGEGGDHLTECTNTILAA